MDRNERTVDFPPELMEDLRKRITPFLLRAYPEPEPLYQKLSQWLGLPREYLLLTAGADGGLKMVHETFVEPGQEVVSVNPSYAMHPVYATMVGAIPKVVQFNEDLSLSLDQILSQVNSHTKAVLLANPNQPIERVYAEEELRTLLKVCLQRDALLVLDEAYHHFCPMTAAPLLKEYGNLIIARTFSKAFGIAGLRLGYLISHPQNIEWISKVRPMYETSSVAIAVGLTLLEQDHLMKSYVQQVKEGMALLRAALAGLKLNALGQWSNSLLVPLPAQTNAEEVGRRLRALRFLVRAERQHPLHNHLRITVGPPQQAQRLLAALTKALQQTGESALRSPRMGALR